MRTGLGTDPAFGAVVPPIYLSTNYTFEGPSSPRPYDYSRSGNPTRDQLNDALATLEGGAGATVLTTGLAAFTLVLESLVPVGGRVLAQHDCYGGTWRLLVFLAEQGRFAVDFVDFNDAEAFAAAIDRRPDLVLVETPSNPLLRITDIRATAEAASGKNRWAVASWKRPRTRPMLWARPYVPTTESGETRPRRSMSSQVRAWFRTVMPK